MRVLCVTAAYPTPNNQRRGSFIAFQVDSLKKMGIEVDVCLLKGSNLSKYLVGIGRVRRMLRTKSYDVVHAYYMYAGWTARLATLSPVVVTYLGNDVLGDVNEKGEYKRGSVSIHRFLSNALALFCSMNVLMSEQMSRILRTRRKIIIPFGVDIQVFRPLAVSRRNLGMEEGRIYVLFAGTDPVKRYLLAKESIGLVSEKYPKAEMLVLDGTKDTLSVVEYMNAADCFLLTSTHEGSPTMVKEALACNLPVVSVDVGDVRKLLTGVDNCHIVEGNPRAIAEALTKVFESRRRSRNAKARVEPLGLERVAERVADVYKSVA